MESYQPTADEEAEMRVEVKRQIEEMMVGQTFWGHFSDGRPWDFTVTGFTLDEFRATVDWT